MWSAWLIKSRGLQTLVDPLHCYLLRFGLSSARLRDAVAKLALLLANWRCGGSSGIFCKVVALATPADLEDVYRVV